MRCCEPCKNITRISCNETGLIRERECDYTQFQSYMVDFSASIDGRANCQLVGINLSTRTCAGAVFCGIECCDRNARLQHEFSGNFILDKYVTNVGPWRGTNVYRYYINNGFNIDFFNTTYEGYVAEIYFSIVAAGGAGYVQTNVSSAYATFHIPHYFRHCNGPTSVLEGFATLGLNYRGFQIPETCDGSFTLQFAGFENSFLSGEYTQPAFSFPVIPPTSVTFTPIIEE